MFAQFYFVYLQNVLTALTFVISFILFIKITARGEVYHRVTIKPYDFR